MLTIIDQGVLSQRDDCGAYMPYITLLQDGAFIAAQHIGDSLSAPDSDIEVLRSTDGKHWTSQGLLHPTGTSGWAYRGPQIYELENGQLIMVAGRCRVAGEGLFDVDSEGLSHYEMLLYRSHDGGESWSAPTRVETGLPADRYVANNAGVLLRLSDDRWMYPLETWKPTSWSGPPDQKAAAMFSNDQGRSWGEFTVIADDHDNRRLWWDQMNTILPDGRIYTMLWTHLYGTSEDLTNHWTVSDDGGRTWSTPKPTNLRGQVCTPIALQDGRVAAIYNFRHEPQGIRVAISEDLSNFDVAQETTVFDAGNESVFGQPITDNFLAEHMQIAFGKPVGVRLGKDQLLTTFWCTVNGVTHTRWVRLKVAN